MADKSNMVFVRPPLILGRPAPIPRRPGLDVTRRPGEGWPRYAIAADGEDLERTPYIVNLIRRGDLVEGRGSADEHAPAEPAPSSATDELPELPALPAAADPDDEGEG